MFDFWMPRTRDPHSAEVRLRARLGTLGHSASKASAVHSSLLEAAESASMLARNSYGGLDILYIYILCNYILHIIYT